MLTIFIFNVFGNRELNLTLSFSISHIINIGEDTHFNNSIINWEYETIVMSDFPCFSLNFPCKGTAYVLCQSDVKSTRDGGYVNKTMQISVTVDVPDRNAFLHRFDVDLR